MSSQRLKVTLNPDREEDRRILDYLLYCGEPKSKVFKKALLQYMEAKTEDGSYEKLLREIRKVIRDELRNAQPYSIEPFPQPVSQSGDGDEVSPLDFLDQLAAMAPD